MGSQRIHLWYDVGWPVVTGLGAGLSLVAAYRWTGPLMFVVAFAVLEVTIAPVAWSLLTESGFDVRRIAFRIAPAGAVALLAVIGLSDMIGGWTFLVVALAVLSSPLFQGWQEAGLCTVVVSRVSARSETRRRFDEIVAHGFETGDEGLPPR